MLGVNMEIGSKFKLSYQVKTSDLAKSLSFDPQDEFPEVLATSRMIALMELAAARLMRPLLSDEELSVGVDVNITHLAATPNNAEVKVIAEFESMQEKLYKFKVTLYDPAGKAGVGTHTRAIVKTKRLIEGANSRANK